MSELIERKISLILYAHEWDALKAMIQKINRVNRYNIQINTLTTTDALDLVKELQSRKDGEEIFLNQQLRNLKLEKEFLSLIKLKILSGSTKYKEQQNIMQQNIMEDKR